MKLKCLKVDEAVFLSRAYSKFALLLVNILIKLVSSYKGNILAG
jgi:hypothetical protein